MSNNNYYDPYDKPADASVPEPFAGQYAGFWVRLIAFIVDALIVGVVEFAIMIPIVIIMTFMITLSDSSYGDTANAGLGFGFCCFLLLVIIATYVIQWLYFAWFESSKYMATPGKMLLGLAVTDTNGDRISFRKATLRFFTKMLTNMIVYIGSIAIAFSSKKQGLYDIFAGTLVVKK